MNALVELIGADVSLEARPVLADLSLAVGPGEALGVAGPNGSGKTTLLRTVGTLLPLAGGSGRVLGHDLSAPGAPAVRRQIELLGHVPALFDDLTLIENLDHMAVLGGYARSRVSPALRAVGLERAAGLRARQSSFGMRRRLELARALLKRPRLLLLDEAISGLDDAARRLVAKVVDEVTGSGGAAILVSHDPSHLAALCHRVERLAVGTIEGAA